MAQPGTPTGGEFAELPEGTPILCKIVSADIELGKPFTDEKTGKEKPARQQVKVILDVISYTDDEGDKVEPEDSRIWYYAGFSLHEKSKLRPLAEVIMPEGTTEEELFDKFDTDMLIDAKVYVIGAFKPGDKVRQYIKPVMFKRYKKGAAAPKIEAAEVAAATAAAAETTPAAAGEIEV